LMLYCNSNLKVLIVDRESSAIYVNHFED
jgi:hypothetical protein